MSDLAKRVTATLGLGLSWFVLVAAGGLVGDHGDAGVWVAVLTIMGGALLGGFLLTQVIDESDSCLVLFLAPAWVVAGMLGVILMLAATHGYEPSFGRPQAAIVMDTRCVPHTDDNVCDQQVRLSTMDSERDLGWLTGCTPSLEPNQRTVVLTDPRGWFRPQLRSCAGGRWFRPFAVGSASFVAALTLLHLVFVVGSTAWERRQLRPRR